MANEIAGRDSLAFLGLEMGEEPWTELKWASCSAGTDRPEYSNSSVLIVALASRCDRRRLEVLQDSCDPSDLAIDLLAYLLGPLPSSVFCFQ